MFNQLLKLGLFVTLGLWLKHRMRGLLYLGLALLLVWLIHSEYLAYVERSHNTAFLEWSFLIKWVLVLASVGLYYLLVERRLQVKPGSSRAPDPAAEVKAVDDGFDFLRNKPVLESEDDKVIRAPANTGASAGGHERSQANHNRRAGSP